MLLFTPANYVTIGRGSNMTAANEVLRVDHLVPPNTNIVIDGMDMWIEYYVRVTTRKRGFLMQIERTEKQGIKYFPRTFKIK